MYQRVRARAWSNVTKQHDCQSVQPGAGPADSVRNLQGGNRILMGAVAGIEDRNIGEIGQNMRGSGSCVAHDHGRRCQVVESLANLNEGRRGEEALRGVHNRLTERSCSTFNRVHPARWRVPKKRQNPALGPWINLCRCALIFDGTVCAIENGRDFDRRQLSDAEDIRTLRLHGPLIAGVGSARIYPNTFRAYTKDMDQQSALALLEWQIELGATEAIGETPVDRYALPAKMQGPATSVADAAVPPDAIDPVAVAQRLAKASETLADLKAAIAAFEHCELKRGARSLVFADGHPGAKVMIIGEAPGRDEDIQGKPFVGRAGQLLDRMFDAIGLSRASTDPATSLYITNVLPWRPPQNRDPKPDEVAMLLPFVERHVALANPDILIAMGNHACQAMLGKRGITRLRGTWAKALDRPILPMFHPAYLLRTNAAKREAWADLLSLKARLAAL